MATTKQRINITADKHMELALKRLAKRDRVPIARKAAELINMALELEEDTILAQIAQSRLTQKVKYIPHKMVWKISR